MQRRFDQGGAQTIRCASCGATAEVGRSGGKAGGKLPPEAAARFFTNKGWHVGSTPRKDRCPDCLNTKRKDEPELAKDAEIITISPPRPGASEEPPREPTREQRRLITMRLEEVYIDENHGYTEGWNDQRVADDMKVPRAWVAEIRDLIFGPQKAEQNPEIVEITARINALEQTITGLTLEASAVRKKADEAAALANQILATSRDLANSADKVRADLRRIMGVK